MDAASLIHLNFAPLDFLICIIFISALFVFAISDGVGFCSLLEYMSVGSIVPISVRIDNVVVVVVVIG